MLVVRCLSFLQFIFGLFGMSESLITQRWEFGVWLVVWTKYERSGIGIQESRNQRYECYLAFPGHSPPTECKIGDRNSFYKKPNVKIDTYGLSLRISTS